MLPALNGSWRGLGTRARFRTSESDQIFLLTAAPECPVRGPGGSEVRRQPASATGRQPTTKLRAATRAGTIPSHSGFPNEKHF